MLDRREVVIQLATYVTGALLFKGVRNLPASLRNQILDLGEALRSLPAIRGIAFIRDDCPASEKLKAFCQKGSTCFRGRNTCWIKVDSSIPLRDFEGQLRNPHELARDWGITNFPAYVWVRGEEFRRFSTPALIGIGANIKALLRANPELGAFKSIYV